MLMMIAKEICKRMEAIGVKGGRKLTLKIMQRRADAAEEPAKFLGHGKCNSLSRTCDITARCDDWKPISAAAFALFEGLGIDKDDVRGVGIVLSKLSFLDDDQDSTGATKMTSWLQSGGKKSDGGPVKDATSTRVVGKSRDDQTIASPAASPLRQAIGSSESTGEGSLHEVQKTRSENSAGATSTGTGNASTTQFEVESPHSTRSNDDGGYALPSLSQIDEDVLAQMPEDVQASVRRLRSPYEMAPSDGKGSDQRRGQSNSKREKETSSVACEDANSVSLAPPVEEEDKGGWALPPLSQIDEEEVLALPTPLRDEILQQIKSKGARSTTSRQLTSAKSPQRTKSTFHTQHSSNNPDSNLRQLSLKRMMKLASVKSGQEDDKAISLSQLDRLPLELQLQIANNEEGPLRSRHQQTRSNDNKSSARGSPHRKTNGSPHRTKGGPMTSNASITGPLRLNDHGEDIQPNFQASSLDKEDCVGDFYHTNILPLAKWMNDHLDPSSDDIDLVKDFFVALLDEKRLDDVTSLLRAIKRRGDIWARNEYDGLLDFIDDRLIATEGRKLDRRYL